MWGQRRRRRENRGVLPIRMGGIDGKDVTRPLARLNRGSRWIHIGNPGVTAFLEEPVPPGRRTQGPRVDVIAVSTMPMTSGARRDR